MDSKKTNLTPELKEIYDRVMNSSSSPQSQNSSTQQPTSPTTPPLTSNPLDVPINSSPHPAGGPILPTPATTSSIDGPIQPTSGSNLPNGTSPSGAAPILPPTDAASGAPPIIPGAPSGMPELPSLQPMTAPTPAEQALSSAPARPVSEGNTFSFSGKANTPAATGNTPTAGQKKMGLSLPVIIILGVVFIIIWGVFWALIFGFIKR